MSFPEAIVEALSYQLAFDNSDVDLMLIKCSVLSFGWLLTHPSIQQFITMELKVSSNYSYFLIVFRLMILYFFRPELEDLNLQIPCYFL